MSIGRATLSIPCWSMRRTCPSHLMRQYLIWSDILLLLVFLQSSLFKIMPQIFLRHRLCNTFNFFMLLSNILQHSQPYMIQQHWLDIAVEEAYLCLKAVVLLHCKSVVKIRPNRLLNYWLDFSANIKTVVKPKPKKLPDYFRHWVENCSTGSTLTQINMNKCLPKLHPFYLFLTF